MVGLQTIVHTIFKSRIETLNKYYGAPIDGQYRDNENFVKEALGKMLTEYNNGRGEAMPPVENFNSEQKLALTHVS